MNLEQCKNVVANANHISNFVAGEVIEAQLDERWVPTETPNFENYGPECFRVRPKPLEFWLNIYQSGAIGRLHKSKEDAIESNGNDKSHLKTIKLMEVPE